MSGGFPNNIYYFFGQAYSDMNYQFSLMSPSSVAKTAYTLYNVFGTLISVSGLVLTTIFAILATVHSIKYLAGKSTNSPIKYCVYTIVSYLGFAMLFATLACQTQKATGVELATTLNGATVAGIVLCLLALITAIAGNIMSKPREFFVKKNIVSLCLNGGKLLLLAISCAFVVETISVTQSSQYYSMEMNMSNAQVLLLIRSLFSSSASYQLYSSNANLALTFTIFSTLFNIAIIVFLCFSIAKTIMSLDNSENRKALAFDIISCSLAFACIISNVITINALQPVINATGTFTIVPVLTIIYLVMSLLVMGVTIAKKIISSKMRY